MQNNPSPVMISVAPNGARVRTTDHPLVPVSPAAIAATVAECMRAGASIAHLHARAPDGSPTHDIEIFREIVAHVREQADIVLQLSLGTRGFTADQAVEPLALSPEMVSLPLRLDGPNPADAKATIRAMAQKVTASSAVAEMSVYDEAMLDTALELVDEGDVLGPLCFGLVLGEPTSFEAGARKLMDLVARLPANAHWWCLKGGRYQLELRALSIALGGHVRIGFEDSVLDFDGREQAPDNAYLVRRMVQLCNALGRPVATAGQTRAMLGL